MLDRPLSECIDRAIARLPEISRAAPASASALVEWVSRLSPTGRARDYFDGPRAVLFLLPWWLEKRIRPTPDIAFQERLVESTINAYYFVRMIDTLMDEQGEEERRLLPLLGMFHANFGRAYARLFPPDEPFWDHFDTYWSSVAEAAICEKRLTRLSSADFIQVAARKTSGVKIPLAAVCCRYGRLDLLEPWCAFYDAFAAWQQMVDDIFDWMRDLQHGNPSFFLSEGERQKREGESIAGWVIRRGFEWGTDRAAASMTDVRARAEGLGSAELLRFLEYRDAEIRRLVGDLRRPLQDLTMLVDTFEGPRCRPVC
jgi:hypothetical protein